MSQPVHRHVIVLCKSVHQGNTQLVAERIGSVLDAPVVDPDDAILPSVGTYLIGVGSGIYYGRFHHSIREWLNRLSAGAGQGHHAFVFSTSGLPFLTGVYHYPIRRLLRRKGFDLVGDFACRGRDSFGPLRPLGGINRGHPSEQDLSRAESFALQLRSRCRLDSAT